LVGPTPGGGLVGAAAAAGALSVFAVRSGSYVAQSQGEQL
jgi:hypothetical protein